MKRIILTILAAMTFSIAASSQNSILKDFKPVCDSLDVMLKKNRDVKGRLQLKNVMKRKDNLDFYFTNSLGDYPWREGEPEWFRKELKKRFPEKYKNYGIGVIYSNRVAFERLTTPELGFDGTPDETKGRIENPSRPHPLVTRLSEDQYAKGLTGRNIAVWQSHGRYFNQNNGEWEWQRPCLFQTVEDMYTQGYVLPYLVPMLENAGAYVLMPRERDIQTNEVIADQDASHRRYGVAEYYEKGRWTDAGTGFAAKKEIYTGLDNPFITGTARKTDCAKDSRSTASVEWRPSIPERGRYAVHISYKSLPESTKAAHYTVHHLGGESEFIVNQSIGGGTWIYLGTFEFAKGQEGYVTLDNSTPQGYFHEKGSVITADAVRFGGGMGNIARAKRGSKDEPVVSGMPRSAEGARYWLQWAGAAEDIFTPNESKDDYADDYMSRGDWVEWISRGSDMNPDKTGGKGIPVDLTLGFHSDAGVTPNDSIVGTLAIYTLKSENREKLPNNENRMTSREYADLVQSQIVHDICSTFDPQWSRRCVWDRGYRESRTPSSPSMLLELLSHQNFADMKYGLDPGFRFTVSRAIYKGMLKYLSNRYGVPYEVQPLPVDNMGVAFASDREAVISWKAVEDPLEPTASAEGYILYTRKDEGAFDCGTTVIPTAAEDGTLSFRVGIEPGHIYSFRIEAYNDGGRSFPSETVSIGMPKKGSTEQKVLIVNNFDRVSAPAFFDTPEYAGFDNSLDSGVPHIYDITYIGEMYQNRRSFEFITNDNPGFGASYSDYAGKVVAGNTFDYPYVHGKSILKAGYAFYSCSNEAFAADSTFRQAAWSADIICGKQVTTVNQAGEAQRFTVFTEDMQQALTAFAQAGGNILVSGAHIATDIWDEVYPVTFEKAFRDSSKKFAREVLGYKLTRNYGSRTGEVMFEESSRAGTAEDEAGSFHNTINSVCYSVEAPDAIAPASRKGSTFLYYKDTRLSAGICYEGTGYRTVCLGFPIETLKEKKSIDNIISITLDFFNK